ncbi:MAG: class I SAM-dependent methyltransferase [Ignavibacterium sp.]|nr:class I SAM-dependent methyltransferase [Ignavibacterium sp.]MCX7611299.1 class I SAM-dependent methyltransferase [Ignavibacterium sp.]MDW8375651.1 class I SAM-dependent methyltransferase [Ignavibacteriales bacterium]
MSIKSREILYSKYHSSFKSITSSDDKKNIKNLFEHYDYKIYPLIKGFDKSSNILELGCGPGYLINYLSSKGFNKIKGIDISKEQIQIAKAANYDVMEIDVFEFFKNNNEKYDLIFAFDFLEHFTKDELIELSHIIYENLNDNGIFLARTPNGQGVFAGYVIYGDLTHQTIFNPNSFIQLMSQAGFEKIVCFENGPVAKNLKGLIRKIVWEYFKLNLNIFRLSEIGGRTDILTQDFYGICYKKSL